MRADKLCLVSSPFVGVGRVGRRVDGRALRYVSNMISIMLIIQYPYVRSVDIHFNPTDPPP